MPLLSRRVSQFFSHSTSTITPSTTTTTTINNITTLPPPGNDMHTFDTKTSFSSSTGSSDESITLEKSPITSTVTTSSPTNRRPRRKTIRKILNGLRFSSDTIKQFTSTTTSPLSTPSEDVESKSPSPIETNTSSPILELPRFESKEPIDFTAIQINFPQSNVPFSVPDVQAPHPNNNSQSQRPSISPECKLNCSDSGYYSLSSSSSPSLPPATLHVIRILNRCIRHLEYQELLTTRFSTNLAYLFGKKEVAIVKTRKIGDDTKELLIITLTKLRELVGKTMVHKMVWGRRSRGVVGELVEACVRAEGGEIHTAKLEGEMDREELQEPNMKIEERISRSVKVLRQDIEMQKRLDEVLRAGIVGSCGDERLMMGLPSRSERLCLRRFVGFVEGRVRELGGAYMRVDRAVGGLEKLEISGGKEVAGE